MIKSQPIISALENIYISPLELCNLDCRYCYTQKTTNILTNTQILNFIKKYKIYLNQFRSRGFLRALNVGNPHSPREKNYDKKLELQSIIFCGGEVFTLSNFPALINQLIEQNIFISIITNGTINKLSQIKKPNNCQLLVSFDGPEHIHDANRGSGNYQKTLVFLEHALALGFPVEIFFLITKDSYPYRNSFPIILSKALKLYSSNALSFTYLTDRLGSLSPAQTKNIRQNYNCYPPKKFGCSILSLQSNGKIYGCCESKVSIGSLSDPLEKVITKFIKKVTTNPLCSDPNYFCNLNTNKIL